MDASDTEFGIGEIARVEWSGERAWEASGDNCALIVPSIGWINCGFVSGLGSK